MIRDLNDTEYVLIVNIQVPVMRGVVNVIQHKTKDYRHNLVWIPFDRFNDVKQIDEGGFARIYSATWLDGSPKSFKQEERSF
ncbi:11801_t:CDS:2 [Funneliformis mosseae]|uniref:11801_t:CDS:1 n=1 Tax=Funneliformis mosseae TaxID=27381 RepID=A0A9N8VSX0_FUNMO|nr:11801_t:CDS:2 [Funneliformis mosseae]